MKKLIYFLALGALLVPASCSKNGGNGGSSGPQKLPPSSTKDYAVVVKIETNEDSPLTPFPGESISQPVEEIIFTEDGEAMVYGKITTKAPMAPIIKRPFKIVPFTVAPSTTDPGYNEYVVPTVGSFLISVKDQKVKYSLASKAQTWVELKVKELKKILTTGVLDENISRTWNLSSIIITVKGGSLGSAGIKKAFSNGCDLYEIAGWCRGQGVKISDSDYAAFKGYKVSKVIFTGDKHFAIEFASAKPYFGEWTLSGTNFGYTLQNMEYDIIGTVSGTFTTDADSKTGQVKVSGKFNVAGTEYTGELDVHLRAK